MGRMFCWLLGIVMGGGVMYAACTVHIVRLEQNWVCVPRVVPQILDSYADVRGWTSREWQAHPALMRAVMKTSHRELVDEAFTADMSQTAVDWLRGQATRNRATP